MKSYYHILRFFCYCFFIVTAFFISPQFIVHAEVTTPGVRYAGVNVDYLMGQAEWESYRKEWYQPQRMVDFLTEVARYFNIIRIHAGSKHLVDPDNQIDEATYLQNMIHTIKEAQKRKIWVQIGMWPNEIGLSGIVLPHFDPYFNENGRNIHKRAVQILAQAIKDQGLTNVLYIDIRNEVSGHIGECYQNGVDWGDVPDAGTPSWRQWLTTKYSTTGALNTAWGASYTSFSQINVFHSNTEVDGKYRNASTVKQDQIDWLQEAWFDFINIMSTAAKTIEPSIKIGNSTTTDDPSFPIYEFANTTDMFRQLIVGEHVDILDMHLYPTRFGGLSATNRLQPLRQKYPNQLIISGESDGLGDVPSAINLYADGVILWPDGAFDTSTKTLKSHVIDFYNRINPYIHYVYPPLPSDGATPTPTRTPTSTLATIKTPTPTSAESLHITYPSWWSQIPDNLKNFLEQLYVLVYYFMRPSNMQYLLEGVFPTPTP